MPIDKSIIRKIKPRKTRREKAVSTITVPRGRRLPVRLRDIAPIIMTFVAPYDDL
jgi:hypothetical protein